MNPTVSILAAEGYFGSLDTAFAARLLRLGKEDNSLVGLGAALASRLSSAGHVCADLKVLADQAVTNADGQPVGDWRWPGFAEWGAALAKSPLVGRGDTIAPLVFDNSGKLYLGRHWDYQARLSAAIVERSSQVVPDVDSPLLQEGLKRLFPGSHLQEDRQRQAALTAVLRRLTVICGGPGTGKTSTVVKLLVLLLEQMKHHGAPLGRVMMVAPTGKAAARLVESVRRAKQESGPRAIVCAPEIRDAIPESAATIHRALGYRPKTAKRYRFHRGNTLPADVVIVDEASMVDLALMTALFDALGEQTRVILLGDKDQLASVEAGSVLADVAAREETEFVSTKFATHIQVVSGEEIASSGQSSAISPMADCVVNLTRSYRFDAASGIGALARAIGAGDGDAVIKCLRDKDFDDVHWCPPVDSVSPDGEGGWNPEQLDGVIGSLCREHYTSYLECDGVSERLKAFDRFRVLCAHRRGLTGVKAVNAMIERSLSTSGLIDPSVDLYPGLPVLITSNHYSLDLFNGDIGMVEGAAESWTPVSFVAADGQIRHVAASRLPAFETAYAMTVHRSQGSEFDAVLIVLPPQTSPLVTRELLYTAVTRAKKKVYVCASETALRHAVVTRVDRFSGLGDELWASKQEA